MASLKADGAHEESPPPVLPHTKSSEKTYYYEGASTDLDPDSLEAPLLPESSNGGGGATELFHGTASIESSTFSLSNTMIGAGIMSLPAAINLLGLVPGVLAILFVSWLTNASIMCMVRCAVAAGKSSYTQVVSAALGFWGKLLLNVSIAVNNFGLLIVFLIIVGDVFCGNESYAGLLRVWLGPQWFTSRAVVLAVVVLLLYPLALQKRLDALRYTSRMSIALALLFVLATVALALTAVARGVGHMPPVWSGNGSSLAIFSVLTVINNAFICHFNVMPIYRELRSSTPRKMQHVVWASLGCCTLIYVAAGVFGVVLFGGLADEDILQNFDGSLAAISPRVVWLGAVVKLGYALSRMLTFPLIMITLRGVLTRGIEKVGGRGWAGQLTFHLLTIAILAAVYVCAVLIPSIWTVFQFMGCTAAVLIGFILPGLTALRSEGGATTRLQRVEAGAIVVLGLVTGVTGLVVNTLDLVI